MLSLKNTHLDVTILDPIADQDRFGTRYCTGGYIFQITDTQHGPLLSGPTYPDSFDPFNGQGIPDAFNRSPLRELDDTSGSVLIIGIGLCNLGENTVTEFCHWDIKHSETEITFSTEQIHQKFNLEFTRTVTLNERTIRSSSHLKNTGRQFIPISWFPHPFFPHPETDELCKLNIPVSFPENPGFGWSESGFIRRKSWPWEKGYFQALSHNAQDPVVVFQKHPALGLIGATCSYVPGLFPIWGNPITFSWEPYYERTLAPGQETSWWIDYEF
ncbi:MAG: hypothetical protein QGG64_18355 [Candidatus Latescibacteria bacterium]|jgi:hypothetical protein|nr:hypothetical protein [Candidatus Latescibacterota bacterium]